MNVSKKIAAWADNTSGSIAIMFTLALVVICGVAGGVVDITRAFTIRSKLQMAADAAVLAAANDPTISEGQAKQEARRYFNAAVADMPSSVKPSFDVKRVKTVARVDVMASTSADVPTTLLGVMGFKTISVTATATAGRSISAVEIYAALDMSGSMGIAADEDNRQRLIALTKPISYNGKGCAFACHQPRPSELNIPISAYDFAKQNGIKVRGDVMNDAFAAYVDEIFNPNDPEVKAGVRRMATYGFSQNLKRLQDLSSNAGALKNSLATFPAAEQLTSNFRTVLPELTKEVGSAGTGQANSPKKMVLLVTDGVRWDTWPIGTTWGPFEGSLCDTIKKNGVEIAVLEVKYFEDFTETDYFVPYILPFYSQITPALQACASPGLYFKVTDSAEAQLRQAFAEVGRAMKGKLSLSR